MKKILKTIITGLKTVPGAYKKIFADPTDFIIAAITLNLFWGVYMGIVEGYWVGFTTLAIVSLRASALFWNCAFAPYAKVMEEKLTQEWQKPILHSLNPVVIMWRTVRWYLVSVCISLLSQVPIQIFAYTFAVWIGTATWDGLLPLTADEWQSWDLFLRNSWFPIAILFSPILGPFFTPVTNWMERTLKESARGARRVRHAFQRTAM